MNPFRIPYVAMERKDGSVLICASPWYRFGGAALIVLLGALSFEKSISWVRIVAFIAAPLVALTEESWWISPGSGSATRRIGLLPFPRKASIPLSDVVAIRFENRPAPSVEDFEEAGSREQLYQQLLGRTWKGWAGVCLVPRTGHPVTILLEPPKKAAKALAVAKLIARITGKPLREE
ncbi:MAG: hypothetical protein NT080_08275 [Spirochaetes bacterium]|nr:hypothetical protein [Spirochaetota bacterium]